MDALYTGAILWTAANMNQWRKWLFPSCILAGCKLTRCILPPTVPDCVLHMQACLIPVRNSHESHKKSLNVPSPNVLTVEVEGNTHKHAFSFSLKFWLISAAHFGLKPTPFITSCELCTDRSCTATILHLITLFARSSLKGLGFFFHVKMNSYL